MLVLLSFGLVLVATVLLVLGLLSDDGLTLIYLSIASSVAAALVLVIALKVNKPRDQVRPTVPEPLPDLEPEPQPTRAMAAAAPTSRGDDEWLAADQDDWSASDDDWQEGDEVEFPIADYDTLSSSQILPLLPQLYADEIPVVEERERSTKARPEILDRLEELRGTATDGDADEDTPATAFEPAPEPAVAADPLASYTEPAAGAWDDEDDWFPIEDYESLSAAQIRPLLPELDAEELAMVRDKESALGRRRSLLDEIDRLLSGGPAPADDRRPTPAPARVAATPSRTARSTPRASTARGTAATKKTAGTKRAAPAKKSTATAGSAGPARKSSAKKAAPAKKASAPAKKASAPAKKAAAPARKAAPAKKAAAPAKKGSAAKKATTTKKAGPAKRATKR